MTQGKETIAYDGSEELLIAEQLNLGAENLKTFRIYIARDKNLCMHLQSYYGKQIFVVENANAMVTTTCTVPYILVICRVPKYCLRYKHISKSETYIFKEEFSFEKILILILI